MCLCCVCRDESYEVPRRLARKRASPPQHASPARRGQAAGPGAAAAGSSGGGARPGASCAHCETVKTPLWRKDRSTGLLLCNACGWVTGAFQYVQPCVLMLIST